MKQRIVVQCVKCSAGTKVEQGLEVVGEGLLREEAVHALPCEKKDDKVVGGIGNGKVAKRGRCANGGAPA